jgi:hexosaminidase
MTPVSTLYFDALPDKNSLSNVYHFQVLPLGLNPTEAKRIIGAQANLWTEYVPSENRADYLYLPRMTALAEVVWSNKDRYASYLTRLRAHYGRLALLNVHYRVPDLSGFVEQSVFIDSTKLLVQKPLSTLVLRYATGDNAVTAASPLLPQPLVIKQPSTIKLAAFTPEGLKGDIYTITYQKQAYAVPVAAKATQPGLRANFFKGLFKVVNEIKAAKPQESFVVSTIQVPEQAKADQFGVQFQGFLDIPETGIYTFYLTCDDGGVLRVADRLVVDNDGLHSAIEKSGQIALEKGLQPLALDFVEGGGGYKLVLKYSKNGSPPQDIPASWLKH